jgi:hypothetical protein
MSNEWHVKNVKTFVGMEGGGFNCTLYHGKKKVALVIDDASGGPLMFHWEDQAARQQFDAYCLTLPKWGAEYGETELHSATPDTAICQMVDEYENDRRFRRHCKTKILFKQPTDGLGEGQWRTLKGAFTAKNVEAMKARFGDDVEILNFRYGQPT